MHIRQIALRNFRSFAGEAVLQLSPHANVVVGRNGAGKSSLVAAIHFAMCGGEDGECVHEGGRLGESACVEIVFCNDDLRFPAQKEFRVSRTVGPGRDECLLDGRAVSRDELSGLFQSTGFGVDSSCFIVQQGRVAELAVLSDGGRRELVKSVAGAASYEKDREASVRMLEETRHTESRVEMLLGRIEDRLKGLEKEKRSAERLEELEREKRKLEYAYAEREISELNRMIAQIETQAVDEESEESEDVCGAREIRGELEQLVRERKRLDLDERYRLREAEIRDRMREAEEAISQLRTSRMRHGEHLERLRKEESEVFVTANYLRYLAVFLGTMDGRMVGSDELEATRSVLMRRVEELRGCKSGVESIPQPRTGLEELVERRKRLWREERRLGEAARSVGEMLRMQENKLLAGGNAALNAYQQIRNEQGVLGCVHELVGVPDELADAFEAVAGNALFNVIVENEEVASRLLARIGTKMTFMPLNRFQTKDVDEVRDAAVISLTSQMKCASRFRPILSHITRNSYLCPDMRSAVAASRKYGINTVTLEGDLVSKRGPISGGYEKKSTFLRDYKKMRGEAARRTEELERVKGELKMVGQEIEAAKMYEEESYESRYGESLRATVMFLQEKLRILEGGKSESVGKIRDEERNLRHKNVFVENEVRKAEMKVAENEFQAREMRDRMQMLEMELEKALAHVSAAEMDRRIEELRGRERRVRELIFAEENRDVFAKPKKMDLEAEMEVAKKHLLIGKRNELCERIGVSDFGSLERLFGERSKEEIVGNLVRVNEKIKEFPMMGKRSFSQWETHIDEKNSLKMRLEDLQRSRERIAAFMEELDVRKEKAVETAFLTIQESFSRFYSRLAEGCAELYSSEDGIGVRMNGEGVDVNALSGGQKTVVALSLVFSIQKIEPSPFYVFDEMDANLDAQTRERAATLIGEMSAEMQFVATTFRKEMVACGARFFGVEFCEKRSTVREISREAACEFLDDEVER